MHAEVAADDRGTGQLSVETGDGEIILEEARRRHRPAGENDALPPEVAAVGADHALDDFRTFVLVQKAAGLLVEDEKFASFSIGMMKFCSASPLYPATDA